MSGAETWERLQGPLWICLLGLSNDTFPGTLNLPFQMQMYSNFRKCNPKSLQHSFI
jgi:hypothetical protein